jgi:hypothetical protein
MTEAQLARAVCSITRTKRRRFLWCAWWTGSPAESPFRPPDAWNGGAKTEEEALQAAEAAAGRTLDLIERRWAGAWLRVRAGLPPFLARPGQAHRDPLLTARGHPRPVDPHAVLGVSAGASAEEMKAAFRRRARELHPDHGGDAAAFIALKRAYDGLVKRSAR